MTDIPVKLLPFKIVSSSVQSGYTNYLWNNFKQGIDITNMHKDSYGDPNIPNLQSQFTKQHVGGDQHRHVPLNLGNDNDYNRPELFKIQATASSLRVYGSDYEDVNKPRAFFWRGTKSPINIANIQNSGNIAGNYNKTYEILQTVGRSYANNLLSSGFIASGNLSTQFITGANNYSLPDITRYTEDNVQYKNNSVFVQRFNSPGGKQESSRGSLDRLSEEFSPNNSLTTRNISVRQPFYNRLTQHSPQFGSGSTTALLPAIGNINDVSIHKVNRNTARILTLDATNNPVKTKKYDNYWIQRSIPQDNFGYAWITASSISDPYTIGNNANEFILTSSIGSRFEVDIENQTLLNSLSSSDVYYSSWKQIRTAEHPVSKKLRELNYLPIEDLPISTIDSRGSSVIISTGKTTNYKEPPITSKHFPIEQEITFRGSTNPIKLKYTFKNTVDNFANNSINKRLSLIDKESKFYNNIVTSKNLQNSPITNIVSLNFKENIFPKAENTYLSGTRSRTQYILDKSGFDRDGYDRQLGTQRVFWRDNQQNRRRSANSVGGYINSLGYSSLEESGSDFTQNENGILFDNSFINHSATLTQNFANLDKGINNSFVLLESGSSERELYTYTGSFLGTIYNNQNVANKIVANTIKRCYTSDIAGEFNNSFVDFYEQFIKNNKKQSIGTIYRNTSYKQMNNSLPISRENLPDVISRTDDESVFVNPKPRYVAFVGGGELNTGSVFDNSTNFTDEYFNTFISGANNTVRDIFKVQNKMYLVGDFSKIGAIPCNKVAVYDFDTQTFTDLGLGSFDGEVYCGIVSGTDLYVGGVFENPGRKIAKWDGTSWSKLAGGLSTGPIDSVNALLLSGNDIYAGGRFNNATSGSRISKWNGTSWSPLGGGLSNIVDTLILSGSDIYAGGRWTSNTGSGVAKWNGTSWTAVGTPPSSNITKLVLSGSDIYAANVFNGSSYTVAKWDGVNWTSFASGLSTFINTLIISGNDFYAGGEWSTNTGSGVAKWNGTNWTPLAFGLASKPNEEVFTLCLDKNNIYAGGIWSAPTGSSLAVWNGSEWSIFNTSPTYNNFSKNILNNSLMSSDVKFSTLDNGLINQKIKTPSYDSIQNYYQSDIYQIGKNFSILPEFRISEHIDYYVSENGNNFTSINNDFLTIDGIDQTYKSANSKTSDFNIDFLEKHSFTEQFDLKNIQQDYSQELEQDKITISVSGIKKLLPYNGFYPQERTIQLANLYGDYVDSVLSGGIYNLNNINDFYNDRILTGNTIFIQNRQPLLEDACYNINVERFSDKYFLISEDQENWEFKSEYNEEVYETQYVKHLIISGSDLWISGKFSRVNSNESLHIVKYSLLNKNFTAFGQLNTPNSSTINNDYISEVVFSGSTLYAVGKFAKGFFPTNYGIAQAIPGAFLSPPGGGLLNSAEYANAIVVSGSDLYVGGSFTSRGLNVAKYNTSTNTWSSLSTGLASEVKTLIVSGNDIYAGGIFGVSKWDGTSWSSIGSLGSSVNKLILSGSDIYAGGSFTSLNRVAKWNGTSWSPLGGGLSNTVETLYLSGNDIYAGGSWSTNTGSLIAKWNTISSTWTGLDTCLSDTVYSLVISGSEIYAGGKFKDAFTQHFAVSDINKINFNSYPKIVGQLYSSNSSSYKKFNQGAISGLFNSSDAKLISSSRGLELFSFDYNDLEYTKRTLHNKYSTNGLNWPTTTSVAIQPIHVNDGFGKYWDYIYENNDLQEKILFVLSSPNTITGSKTAAGAVSFVTATMKQDLNANKYWEYSNKITLGTGSANITRFGTGLSILSCSSGYQVFIGELLSSLGAGNIWVTTSSNGNVWSKPISILSGTTLGAGLGFNNIKSVNFKNKSYVFLTEIYNSGTINGNGNFFVISSSDNNNWGNTNINSQKTFLYKAPVITNPSNPYKTNLDVIGSNRKSIEVFANDISITYCLVDSQETPEQISQIMIGNTFDGKTWTTQDDMFRQIETNRRGYEVVGLSSYDIDDQKLPIFFTNISSSAGLNSIYAIHNNQFTQFSLNVSGTQKYIKQAALEPIMAPGILYNTIKSGIAVDWPCSTGSQTSIQPYGSGTIVNAYYPQSFKMSSHQGTNINELNMYGSLKSNVDYRVNFEKLIFPEQIFINKNTLTSSLIETTTLTSLPSESELVQFVSGCYIYGGYEPYISPVDVNDYNQLGPKRFSVPFVYKKAESNDSGLYSMAMSNFLAETVKFFLTGGLLTSFKSRVDSEWPVFEGNKKYYMDIVIFKSKNLVMMEAYHSDKHPVGPKGQKMNGRYFGYPVNKTNKKLWSKESDQLFTQTEAKLIHNDPAYAPYTPPYFEGEAIARVYFEPTASNKYSLEQVLSGLVVENIFPGVLDGAHINSDAYLNKMPIEASLNIKGKVSSGEVTNNTTTGERQERNDGTKNSWVISTKFETPVLDFSNQSSVSYENNYSKKSGYGRGMWSGYGNIPDSTQNIQIELRESPQGLVGGQKSLLQQVGFQQNNSKKIGVLCGDREKSIKEAIMIIPFVDGQNSMLNRRSAYFGTSLPLSDIEKRLKKTFISINYEKYQNIIRNKTNSSILDTYNKMQKYIIPPELDYILNPSVSPYVAYIIEFEHKFLKQELADIWQGVSPRIANVAELDQVELIQNNSENDFYHGFGIPNNVRFMIFKVKQKGEFNYFNVTEDSSDDQNFKFTQRIGNVEKSNVYSYNWPYDYCSLVELAKVDLKVSFKKKV